MNVPRLTFRTATALLVVVLAVVVGLLWLAYRAPIAHLEDPNCLEPADFEKSLVRCTQSQAIDLCDLVNNPDRYDHKIVRVGTILVGYHHQHLYDPSCNGDGTLTWADYDSPEARDKLMRAVAALNDRGFQRGNIWVKVKLAGRFEERQPGDPRSWVEEQKVPDIHPIRDRFRFVIMNVEHAEPVAKEVAWPK